MSDPDPAPSQKFTRGDAIALSLFSACMAVYFWPLILAQSALFYFDVTELNYAYRHLFAENLKKGIISFWCNELYNGFPIYSESQTGYWHPLKYVFYPWLSTWSAFGYDMVASLAIAGLGTYFWLRRHATPAGSLAGSLLVTFGGFTWAHFVHTSMVNALASVPWLIWGLERSWRTGRLWGAFIAGLALACQVFAGHLQDAVFSIQLIAILTAYQVAIHKSWKMRRWLVTCGGFAMFAGVLIAAVQWMPSYELLKRTPRTEGLSWKDQTFGSWHPQLLPSLFVRESYGTRARDTDWMDGFYPYHEMNSYLGATAMLLALIGARRRNDPWVGMWVVVGFISAVFMLGRFTIVMDFWHRVPVLGSSRIPVRYHLWATLATAALVATGLSQVMTEPGKIRLRKPLLILALFAIAGVLIFAWTMIPWWTESNRWTTTYHRDRNNWLTTELIVATVRSILIFSTGAFIISRIGQFQRPFLKNLSGYGIAVLIGIDLMSAHWYEMPTVDPSFWTKPPASVAAIKSDPKAGRVMGVPRYSAGEPGYASMPIDFYRTRDALGWSLPLAYGLESNIGETPFRPARLIRLTDLAGGEAWRFSIEGVTHLVTGQKLNSTIRPILADSAFVYRLPDPEPRYHWATHVRQVADDVDAEAVMKEFGAKNAGDTVVVELPDDGTSISLEPVAPEDITTGIDLLSDRPDRLHFHVQTPTQRFLRIGVSFDPGWQATLDGRPLSVHPAQLAFMGVFVPAGDHEIKMSYRPRYFRVGLGLTVFGLFCGFLLSCVFRAELLQDDAPIKNAPFWTSPGRLALALAILLLISSVGTRAGGGLGLSSRWNDSWHRFTWGAGIEAMGR